MSFVCLWRPSWESLEKGGEGAFPDTELVTAFLTSVPRIVIERGCLWCDARGLEQSVVVTAMATLLDQRGDMTTRLAAATTAIAAELLARHGANRVTVVPTGDDARQIASLPLAALGPDARLRPLLEGLGLMTCGDLGTLDLESVEVRLGADGVRLWRLARADDARRIFTTIARESPHASLDWTEYVLRDPERLLFVVNALADRVCATLAERGEGARELALVLSLANGATQTERLRSSRPTASRKLWMRQLRALLFDRLTLPEAVTGVLLRAEAVAAKHGAQGDLFDRGFASAGTTEQALAQLVDDQAEILVAPNPSLHPLVEVRSRWVAESATHVVERARVPEAPKQASLTLTLQLLPHPQPVAVQTKPRRDHEAPTRYYEQTGRMAWHELVDAAGPDRVSGAHWEVPYAREYFRCVRDDGLLVWLFRDARNSEWYLHGWWD
ncbi:MAG: DNA polymerase Y family protein [Gemmatimonadaceae bacterium]